MLIVPPVNKITIDIAMKIGSWITVLIILLKNSPEIFRSCTLINLTKIIKTLPK